MQSNVSTSSRILGIFFAVLFNLVTIILLVVVPAERLLFNPQRYEQAFQEQGLHQEFPALLADQLVYELDQSTCADDLNDCPAQEVTIFGYPVILPTFFQNLSQQDWQMIIEELTTEEWFREQSHGLIQQYFAYLNTSSEQLELTVSLTTVKHRLAGNEGLALFLKFISKQPSCTAEQIFTIVQQLMIGLDINQAPVCNPSEGILNQVTPVVQAILINSAQSIPNEINLAQRDSESSSNPSETLPSSQFQTNLRQARKAIRLSPLLPLIFLFLLAVFAVRSMGGLFKWWGITFLVTGIAGVILAFTLAPLGNWLFTSSAARWLPAGLAPGLNEPFYDVLRYVLSPLTGITGIAAVVLGSLGIAMLIVGLVLRS